MPRFLLGTGKSAFIHTRLLNQLSRLNGRANDGNMRRVPVNQPVTIHVCALDMCEAPTAAASNPLTVTNRRPHEPMAVTRKSRASCRTGSEASRAKASGEADRLVARDRACSVLGFVWHCRLFLAAKSGKAASRAALSSQRTDQRSRLHPAGWRTKPGNQP